MILFWIFLVGITLTLLIRGIADEFYDAKKRREFDDTDVTKWAKRYKRYR